MSRRTRRTARGHGPLASRLAAKLTDRSHSSDTSAPVDIKSGARTAFALHRLLGTLPPVLALSATGRVGTRHARLEHLQRWLAYEKDSTFTTVEKATLIEAVTPFMDETTLLGEAIAGYLVAQAEVPA